MTEQAYLNWIKQYILFHGEKHPQDLAAPVVEALLTGKLPYLPKNQAFSALLFLYREVLQIAVKMIDQLSKPPRLIG